MATYELWRHTTSGEVYVVAVEGDSLVGAAGPLAYTEHAAALTGDWDNDDDVLADLRQAAPTEYRLLEWTQ